MKHLFILLAVGFSTLSAHAGYMKLTCASADGAIVYNSDDQVELLVRTQESDSLKNGMLQSLVLDERIDKGTQINLHVPSRKYLGGAIVGQLKLTSSERIETTPEEYRTQSEEDCGPGMAIYQFDLSGVMKLNGKKYKVQLTCQEESGWGGSCNF